MFGTNKELLLWIVGLSVAGVVTIWAALYAVDHFIVPHEPSDPLKFEGGLDRQQRIEAK